MHIDTFDSAFDQPQPQTTTATYTALPEGRAEVEIKAASIGNVSWKVTDKNPSGECLKLRLSGGRQYAFVFCDLPKDRPYLFKALAAALGIGADADGKTTLPQPHELVGRAAMVEIGHHINSRGETKATVRKWLPVDPPAAAAPQAPAPRRAAASVARRTETHRIAPLMPDDDIPF